MPLVSVGIPTFNRPDGLRRTLSCIAQQTYRHLEIVVSDNHSSDPRVAEVCREFGARDARIRLHRQATNLGPTENFRFVLRQASGKYFMWAADDDSWEPRFIESLVALLERDPNVGVAFCNFDARLDDGTRVDSYPEFLPLLQSYAGRTLAERLSAYIAQEEGHGKANMLYGLYRRTELLAAGGMRAWGLGWWGADMLIVCSVLARSAAAIESELLYHVGAGRGAAGAASVLQNVGSARRRFSNGVAAIRGAAVALLQHAGYVLGYARIVSRAADMSFGARLDLYGVILRKFAILARRDLVGGS
jgi:hypothetical protein